MPFIVQTDEGETGANSYASIAELDAYAEFRLDLTNYTEAQKQAALVVASSTWVDGYHTFRSEPVSDDQGLWFPTAQDGFPLAIKHAAMNAALLQLQGLLLVNLAGISVSGEVESESKSVGPLSTSKTYRSGSSQRYYRLLPRDLTSLLTPYLLAGSGLGWAYRL